MNNKILIVSNLAFISLANERALAVIDADDVALIENYSWHVAGKGNRAYALSGARFKPARKNIRMHRLILPPPDGMVVDHIDGNGLNNRRSNLRLCTSQQNMFNKRRKATKTVPFKGVYLERGWFVAKITKDRQQHFLGCFSTPELAHEAYCQAAQNLFGEFARAA